MRRAACVKAPAHSTSARTPRSENERGGRRRCSASYVIPEDLTQVRLPPLVVNARRPNGNPKDVGGRGNREILVKHEMKHVALARREPVERREELLRGFVADDR